MGFGEKLVERIREHGELFHFGEIVGEPLRVAVRISGKPIMVRVCAATAPTAKFWKCHQLRLQFCFL